MERTIFGEPCEPFKSAPYIPEVRKRINGERLVVQVGLGLNAFVIGIIIYAELFLR